MTDRVQSQRPDVLIQKHMDGLLSAPESRKLQAWLLDEPANMEYFLAQVDIHVELHEEQQVSAMGVDIHAVDEQALLGRKSSPAPAPSSPRLTWLRPLAIAAGILAVVGGALLLKSDRDTVPRIVRQSGSLQISGHDVRTGPGAGALLRCPDGTLLALDRDSRISAPLGWNAPRNLEHNAGRAYLDVAKAGQPFTIRSGRLNTTVTGTRLLLSANGLGSVRVLDGEARVGIPGVSCVLRGGESVQPSFDDSPPFTNMLEVTAAPPSRGEMDWLASLGLTDPGTASGTASSLASSATRLPFNASSCQLFAGDWKMDPSILSANASGDRRAIAVFGKSNIKRGTFSFDLLVWDHTPRTSLNILLHWGKEQVDGIPFSEPLRQALADAGPEARLAVRAAFSVHPSGQVSIDEWTLASRGKPAPAPSFPRLWGGTRPLSRPGRGFGLEIGDCRAEFSNLRLENAEFLPDGGRIEDSLLARYRFDEGAGTRVTDSAGTEQPMDFTIHAPGIAKWQASGLSMPFVTKGRASITTETCTRMAEIFRKTGGLTIEFWTTHQAGRQVDSRRQYALLDFIWQNGWFNYTQSYPGETTIPKAPPGHSAITLTRKGPHAFMCSYNGGELMRTQEIANLAMAISDRPFHLAIPGGMASNMADDTDPWAGIYHFIGIHGRALSAPEVKINHQAGIPAAGPSTRVNDGLLSLYSFDEGGGDVIRSRLGSGRNMDLHIQSPKVARWTDTGLSLTGAADVTFKTPSEDMRAAWLKNQGVTVEVWFRMPRTAHPNEHLHNHAQLRAGNMFFSLNTRGPEAGRDLGRLCQAVMVLTREKGQIVGYYYTDGRLDVRQDHGDFATHLDSNPHSLILGSPRLLGNQRRWSEFELQGAAIYGRALAPDEIVRNFSCGRPRPPVPLWTQAQPLVQYRFDEGTGTVIQDRGLLNPRLDLHIRHPERTEWTRSGLRLTGPADICWDEPAAPFREAWEKNGGFTLALWARFPSHPPPPGLRHVWSGLTSGPYTFACGLSDYRDIDLGQFMLTLCSIKKVDGGAVMAFFTNDEPSTAGQNGNFTPFIQNSMRLNLAPSNLRPPDGIWKDFELCHFTVFDRPFDAAQVREYHRNGPPARQ